MGARTITRVSEWIENSKPASISDYGVFIYLVIPVHLPRRNDGDHVLLTGIGPWNQWITYFRKDKRLVEFEKQATCCML